MNTVVGTVRSYGAQAGQALASVRTPAIVALIVGFLLLLDFAPNLAMWLAFALFLATAINRLPGILKG